MIKKKIISEVKKAKYCTRMLYSTRDVAREDQIAEILRYLHINENKDSEIKKVFLGFLQVSEKNATSLAETMIEKLNDDGIDFQVPRNTRLSNFLPASFRRLIASCYRPR